MAFDKNKAEFILFLSISKFVTALGFKRVKYVAKPLANFFYYLLPIRKDVVIANLKKAFPEKSEKEIKLIAKKNYESFAITFLELMAMRSLTPENVLDFADCETLSVLEDELKEGKGVFLMSAHFGNWEYAGTWLGVKINRSILGLAKKQRNPYVNDWLTKTRGKFGNRELRAGAGLRGLISAAKNGEIIVLVGDQRGASSGPRVKFFDNQTAVYTGTAALSLKLGLPIILLSHVRQPDGKYHITFEKLMCEENDEHFDNPEICLTQKYFKFLEKLIIANPEQWLWMHNIWKY